MQKNRTYSNRNSSEMKEIIGIPSKIKVYVEHLYHFTCTSCRKWWTCADLKPQIGDTIYCPHCGLRHQIAEFEVGEDKLDKSEVKLQPNPGQELPLYDSNKFSFASKLNELEGKVPEICLRNAKELWIKFSVNSLYRVKEPELYFTKGGSLLRFFWEDNNSILEIDFYTTVTDKIFWMNWYYQDFYKEFSISVKDCTIPKEFEPYIPKY